MNSIPRRASPTGISPVMGVILLVAVSVILSAVVGMAVMELAPDSSSGVRSAAVSVAEHDDGILIRVIESGKALDVVKNGVVVHSFVGEAGEAIKVSGVNEGDMVSLVLNESASPKTVVYTHTATQSIAVVDGGVTVISAASGSSGGASQYGRVVTISDTSGSTLTDYPVKVVITGSDEIFTKAASDGSDVRFYDSSGNELFSWTEQYNASTQTAVFWVKAPSIPANGDVEIAIKYGDGLVVPQADKPHQVFIYYDDFTSSANWTSTSAKTSVDTTNGNLYAHVDTTTKEWAHRPINLSGYPDWTMEIDYQPQSGYNNEIMGRVNFGVANFAKEMRDVTTGDVLIGLSGWCSPRLVNTTGSYSAISTGTCMNRYDNYHATISKTGGDYSLTVLNGSGTLGGVHSSSIATGISDSSSFDRVLLAGHEYTYGGSYRQEAIFQQVWIRNSVAQEPTVTVSSP